MRKTKFTRLLLISLFLCLLSPIAVYAHGVSSGDATFVQANQGLAISEYLYLGAKHMVTGYDHL